MKAEITFSQVWANPSVRSFFFRDQSENTLQELKDKAVDFEDALERIENYANTNFLDLDEIEEMFYHFEDGSVETLAKEFEIELYEDDDDDDEQED